MAHLHQVSTEQAAVQPAKWRQCAASAIQENYSHVTSWWEQHCSENELKTPCVMALPPPNPKWLTWKTAIIMPHGTLASLSDALTGGLK